MSYVILPFILLSALIGYTSLIYDIGLLSCLKLLEPVKTHRNMDLLVSFYRQNKEEASPDRYVLDKIEFSIYLPVYLSI